MPAGAFLIWFALAGRSGLKETGDYLGMSVFSKIPSFVATNLAADVGKTAGWARGGHVLAAAVLAWVLWHSWGTRGLFRRHPAVLGGAVAAVVFYALAALGRDRISATEAPSRYAYVGIAFMLPTFALILTAVRNLVDRRREGPVAAGRRVRCRRYRRYAATAAAAAAGGVGAGVGAGAGAGVGAVSMARGRRVGVGLWPYLRLVVVAVVLLATLSNTVAGIRFARSRTVYVRGLENQIITSAALLQSSAQMANAVDNYPIWASGDAAGYLTPEMLASLYGHRLLPRPSRALMTPGEILSDETWLDITDKHHLFHDTFHLLSTFGVRWYGVPPRQLFPVSVEHHGFVARAVIGWPRAPAPVSGRLPLRISSPASTRRRCGSVSRPGRDQVPSGCLSAAPAGRRSLRSPHLGGRRACPGRWRSRVRRSLSAVIGKSG